MREGGEKESAGWSVCDVADDAGALPSPSPSPTSLTHTSTAESWLWAQPLYCRERRATASVRGLRVRWRWTSENLHARCPVSKAEGPSHRCHRLPGLGHPEQRHRDPP